MSNLLNEGYSGKFRIQRAKNQYIFDSNNKKFIDLSMCSGTMILGHSSKEFKKAIEIQKNHGSSFGLPNKNADNYSYVLKKIFPHYSKFILSSSGAEANIRAVRLARAITKKDLIIMVSGSWHGSVDSLLFDLKDRKKESLSDGIPNNYKKNVIVIPYNNFNKSKKIIQKNKRKIALLIIEPIQQYLPTNNSEVYIKKIFHLCKKNKILVCFDEMITGMRTKEFSVQQKLNLRPDISTFGKIVGGGLPIGVLGVSKKIERKIKKNNIFFGGTYSANPLACYTGLKTLEFIIKNKTKIYKKLDNLSKFFVKNMNQHFIKNKIKMRIYNYHTMMRLIFTDKNVRNREERDNSEKKIAKKIFKLQEYSKKNNVIYPSRGAFFLSYAHEKNDILKIIKVFKKGIKKFFQTR